jgi:hypothetical protein
MKKLLLFLLLIMISPLFSCDTKADKNEINPAILLLFGSNTLTVKVTYNGTASSDASATKKIYVYLYNQALGTTPRSPDAVYTGSTAGAVTVGVEETISISGVASGNYYVLVFYDFKSGSNPDNKTDRYVLYDGTVTGTACTSAATLVNIPTVTTLNITFANTNQFQDSGVPSGGPLFVTAGCP